MSLSFRELVFGNQSIQASLGEWNDHERHDDDDDDNNNNNNNNNRAGKEKTASLNENDGNGTSRKRKPDEISSSASKSEKSKRTKRKHADDDDDDYEFEEDEDDDERVASSDEKNKPAGQKEDNQYDPLNGRVNMDRIANIALARLDALYNSLDRKATTRTMKQDGDNQVPDATQSSQEMNADLSENHLSTYLDFYQHIPSTQTPRPRSKPVPQPTRKRKRRRRRKYMDEDSSVDESVEEEKTADEIEAEKNRQELGRLKIERSQEWRKIRMNWKIRKYDLRDEEDVGGAIRAAILLNKTSASKGKTKAKPSEFDGTPLSDKTTKIPPPGKGDASAVNDVKVESDGDEFFPGEEEKEDDPHGDILKRLVTAPEEKKQQNHEVEMFEQDKKILMEPYKNRLDFWELGKRAPKVDRTLLKPVPIIQQDVGVDGSITPDTSFEQVKFPGLRIRKQIPYPKLVRWETHFEPAEKDRILPLLKSDYSQKQQGRNMFRLIARYMATTPRMSGKEAMIANRMLRILWTPPLNDFSWKTHVIDEAKRCGKRLDAFLNLKLNGSDEFMLDKLGIRDDCALQRPKNDSLRPILDVWQRAERRRKKLIEASTSYVFVPGSEPPPPALPLNSLGFEFGPTDRFNFVFHLERVSEETEKISLSALFVRWMSSEESKRRHGLEKQMCLLMKKAVQVNHSRAHRGAALRRKAYDEVPLFPLYRSMMTFVSLIANNGGRAFTSPNDVSREEEDDDADDDDDDDDDESRHGLKASTVQIFDFVEQNIGSNGIQAFPRIHLIYALVLVARGLPEKAIEILATPLDAQSHTSPFTIIRSVLEFLEQNGLLVESATDGHITVQDLEYAFVEATRSLSKCIETDPTEPEYHAWKIALKAGSLLLCSGNRIGGAATLLPSSMVKQLVDSVLFDMVDQQHETSIGPEVRPMLKKFAEARLETAKAFELLLALAKRQDSARCHEAVAAFLEWPQVVALLVGDSEQKHSYFTEIRRMHSESRRRWARLERSENASAYLKRMEGPDRVLISLANDLENSPHDIVLWRRFIRALGPLHSDSERRDGEEAPQGDTEGPGPLRSEPSSSETNGVGEGPPLDVDDVATSSVSVMESEREARDERNPNESPPSAERDSTLNVAPSRNFPVWARDRLSWWPDVLLHVRHPDVEFEGSVNGLVKKARSILENIPIEKPSGLPEGVVFETVPNYNHVEWLEACIQSNERESPSGDRAPYDHLLPQEINKVLESAGDFNSEAFGNPFPALEGVNPRIESICFKVLIRCHLFGPSDPCVAQTVRSFLHSVWKPESKKLKNKNEEWRALEWLHSMGVDVISNLPVKTARRGHAYPKEMRRIVLKEVARHGFGRWSYIQAKYPHVFQGLSRTTARNCYLSMENKAALKNLENQSQGTEE